LALAIAAHANATFQATPTAKSQPTATINILSIFKELV
jgi:hypothetical protein